MKTHRSTSEIKAMAREQLLGKYGSAIAVSFVIWFITMVLSMLTSFTVDTRTTTGLLMNYGISFILNLITSIFSLGMIFFYLNLCRGKKAEIKNVFWGFSHHPDKAIIITLFIFIVYIAALIPFGAAFAAYYLLGKQTVYILLMTLGIMISIIGIVTFSLNYTMAYNVLADHYDYSVRDILRSSRELMHGHKLHYLYLCISFLGWLLLSLLSCGIGYLWIMPYIGATQGYFYLDIIGELDAPEVIETPVDEDPYQNLYR